MLFCGVWCLNEFYLKKIEIRKSIVLIFFYKRKNNFCYDFVKVFFFKEFSKLLKFLDKGMNGGKWVCILNNKYVYV